MLTNRKLSDLEKKRDFNAWDKEELKDTALEKAHKKIQEDLEYLKENITGETFSNDEFLYCQKEAWNNFYSFHKEFFKNRKWILKLDGILDRKRIIDLGCGNGSSLHEFHLLNQPKRYYDIYGCDLSIKAVEICRERIEGSFFVYDLTCNYKKILTETDGIFKENDMVSKKDEGVLKQPGMICQQEIDGSDLQKDGVFDNDGCLVSNHLKDDYFDSILLIFTLSSIPKHHHKGIIRKAYNALKPGGRLYFKDYGVLDMVQLRYKKENILDVNFYRRADGTLTYFFSKEYFLELIGSLFKVISIGFDKKLLLNRKRGLDMYRVYFEGILEK